MKTMLLCFAHPDDESFTCGGVVPKYVANGWTVHLVCATNGEAGNAGPYELVSHKQLGAIRQSELEHAMGLLGISSVEYFNYADGKLASGPAGELENRLYGVMLDKQPDIVITFDMMGISNHPDHIAISHATTYAFQKYARQLLFPQQKQTGKGSLPDEMLSHSYAIESGEMREPRLYYATMPASLAQHLVEENVIPAESFGKPWKGMDDKKITTVIDVSRYKSKKVEALSAHRTQQDDTSRFLNYPNNPLLRQEFFLLRMQGLHEVFMGKNDRVADRL